MMKKNNSLSIATMALLIASHSLEAFDRSKLKCAVDKKLIGAAVGGVFTGIGLTCLVFKLLTSKEVVKEKPWPAGNSFEIDIPKKLDDAEVQKNLKEAKAKLTEALKNKDKSYYETYSTMVTAAHVKYYLKVHLPKTYKVVMVDCADAIVRANDHNTQLDYIKVQALSKTLQLIENGKELPDIHLSL